MLQSQLPFTHTTISCSRRGGRRRRPKPKPIAFPPTPLRRLVSSSFCRLRPRPHPLLLLGVGGGNGWFGRRRRRSSNRWAEEVAALALSLAFGDGLAGLVNSWNSSGLSQMLGICAALCKRAGRRGRFWMFAAFLLGIAFCCFVCHFRGLVFLEDLEKMGRSKKWVRILLH